MHQHTAKTLPWPTDWTALFGSRRPLILEIGFGYGHYLRHLAQTRPDCHIIGLEIASKCLQAGEALVAKHGWQHVQIVYSPAETALYHLFEPATLREVQINFPDPWFKKRHDHRRLMQRDTLDAVVNRLEVGGKLYLATDIIEYAEMSAELLAATPGLTNLLPTPWVHHLPERGVVTKYEAKAQREGRPCHYFVYQRNATPAPVLPLVQEYAMPHIVFQTPLDLDALHATFQQREEQIGATVISVMDVFRGRHSLLVEVYVKEPTIDQHVAFIVADKREDSAFTIKLSALGHPRPTLGMHLAAGVLGDWLLGLHPAAQVIHRKLNPEAEALLAQHRAAPS